MNIIKTMFLSNEILQQIESKEEEEEAIRYKKNY